MKKTELNKTVERVAELSIQIKEIEKELKPLKEKLIVHARTEEIAETTDLGAVSIVVKDTCKQTIMPLGHSDPANWLYRLIKAGFAPVVNITIDSKQLKARDCEPLRELLNEAGYTETHETGYSIKINAI